MSGDKTRLDQHLVNLSYFESRARAAAAIKAGHVKVNGQVVSKAAAAVSAADEIEAQPAHDYVSRGGMKLAHALAQFNMAVARQVYIDVGASTGGFTDVLLRHDAAFVYAVDVGQEQLHQSLRQDARVKNMAGVNARDLRAADFDRPLDGFVCDVSFINLQKALAALMDFMPVGSHAIALIKPQFEVGKAALGKNGVVTDAGLRAEVCDRVRADWQAAGWTVLGLVESPITGPQGNVEYLIGGRKQP